MSSSLHPDLNESRRRFYALATAAIKAGKLTEAERDAIARPGTRKAGYWKRHLRDLRGVLADRQGRDTGLNGAGVPRGAPADSQIGEQIT